MSDPTPTLELSPDLAKYPPCMTMAQCAEYTGYSADTLRRWWHQGKFPGRMQGHFRVPRYALQAWMAARERREDSEVIQRYGKRTAPDAKRGSRSRK